MLFYLLSLANPCYHLGCIWVILQFIRYLNVGFVSETPGTFLFFRHNSAQITLHIPLCMNRVRSWVLICLGSRKPSPSWRHMTVRPLVKSSDTSNVWKCLGFMKPLANSGSSVFSGWDQRFIQRSRSCSCWCWNSSWQFSLKMSGRGWIYSIQRIAKKWWPS